LIYLRCGLLDALHNILDDLDGIFAPVAPVVLGEALQVFLGFVDFRLDAVL